MDQIKPLPSYTDVQKVRLMEAVHHAFFDGWAFQTPLSVLLAEAIERLQVKGTSHEELCLTRGFQVDPAWFVWDGDMDEFLEHLYYARIPGCVPFDTKQSVKQYVEVSFGEDAFEYLQEAVDNKNKKEGLELFGNHLAACSFSSKRLKLFRMPHELELLAAAALRRQQFLPPLAEAPPSPPPMKTDPRSPQGKLF
ncbi:MAG: hypothetical protein ACAH17_03765 [Candidatus Paceibacterota bacterium]